MTAMRLPPHTPEQATTSEPPLGILLVDDHPLFAEGVAIVLDAEPRFEIVGTATDGREGVKLAAALHPHIVLMDLSMPVMDGFEATALLRATCPDAAVVILSGSDAPADVERAYLNGASAYVRKDRILDLPDCLRSLASSLVAATES
jgi:DNA-binding NarL/FixJ family response regulator